MTTGSQSLPQNLIPVKYFGYRMPRQCKSFSFTVENNLHASAKLYHSIIFLSIPFNLRIKLLFWSKSYARLGWWTVKSVSLKGKSE